MADLAVRYAEALLKAAKRENALPVVAEEIEFLAHEFSHSAMVFYSPVFSVREQLATVDYVLGDNFHPLVKRFFCLLAAMRRLGGIEKIANTFALLAHKEMKRIDLFIKVYDEIDPEMVPELTEAVCKKGLFDPSFLADISPHISVDKNLLGGFIAECEGISWDCSLRTRLNDASKAMRRVGDLLEA